MDAAVSVNGAMVYFTKEHMRELSLIIVQMAAELARAVETPEAGY